MVCRVRRRKHMENWRLRCGVYQTGDKPGPVLFRLFFIRAASTTSTTHSKSCHYRRSFRLNDDDGGLVDPKERVFAVGWGCFLVGGSFLLLFESSAPLLLPDQRTFRVYRYGRQKHVRSGTKEYRNEKNQQKTWETKSMMMKEMLLVELTNSSILLHRRLLVFPGRPLVRSAPYVQDGTRDGTGGVWRRGRDRKGGELCVYSEWVW